MIEFVCALSAGNTREVKNYLYFYDATSQCRSHRHSPGWLESTTADAVPIFFTLIFKRDVEKKV
jgi:hypothetical protein